MAPPPSSLLILAAVLATTATATATSAHPNPTTPPQPIPPRVQALIAQMTLDEKTAQLSSSAPAIPRLNLPAYNYGTECLHGVVAKGNLSATVFPQPIALAATFDAALVFRIATAISDEARALNNGGQTQAFLSCFSPNMNIFRSPLWGRGSETYGECPTLTSAMVEVMVTGLQGNNTDWLKVAGGCKHFAAYNLEQAEGISRFEFDAIVSQKDMAETYLPAWETCVRKARSASIMCSYNSINGTPSCANPALLTSMLRETWNFTGYVVSDCGAVGNLYVANHYAKSEIEAAALALNAGTDLDCGGGYASLADAVRAGLVTTEAVDRALTRALTLRFRLGQFDPAAANPYSKIPTSVIGSPEHLALARRAAAEGIVLLKNTDDFLPLKSVSGNITMIGPSVDDGLILLGNYVGMGHGNPTHDPVTPLAAFTAEVGASRVTTSQGCWIIGEGAWKFQDAVAAAAAADVAFLVLGSSSLTTNITYANLLAPATEKEGLDRRYLVLPGVQPDLIQAIAKLTTTDIVLVLINGGGVDVDWAVRSPRVKAILTAWYPGQEGGSAIADVVFGRTSPSGRLPVTWYFNNYTTQQSPMSMSMSAWPGRTYKYTQVPVLFPFGYGLSYARFVYSKLAAQRSGPAAFAVQVSLENTGGFDQPADQSVLLFARFMGSPRSSTETLPLRTLVAFERVEGLATGRQVQVNFALDSSAFVLTAEDGTRAVRPGPWQLQVEGLTTSITVQA